MLFLFRSLVLRTSFFIHKKGIFAFFFTLSTGFRVISISGFHLKFLLFWDSLIRMPDLDQNIGFSSMNWYTLSISSSGVSPVTRSPLTRQYISWLQSVQWPRQEYSSTSKSESFSSISIALCEPLERLLMQNSTIGFILHSPLVLHTYCTLTLFYQEGREINNHFTL